MLNNGRKKLLLITRRVQRLKIKNIYNIITDRNYRKNVLDDKGFYNYLSDEKYLKMKFKDFFGYELNLDNPKTYCEKLQ